MSSMDNKSALDGRFQVVGNDADGWIVLCDGSPQIATKNRMLANDIFQMVLRAHEIGRTGAFYDVRKLIGAS